MIAPPVRIPVNNVAGKRFGYVEFSTATKLVQVEGRQHVPREYLLRIDSADTEPSITVMYRVDDHDGPVVVAVTVDGGHIGPNVFDTIRRNIKTWNEVALRAAVVAPVAPVTVPFPGIGNLVARPAELAADEPEKRSAEKTLRQRVKIERQRAQNELHSEVAAIYNDNVEDGNAYHALAQRFGRPESTLRRWVGLARDAGYELKTPPRGRLKPRPNTTDKGNRK